jgi:two-component system chemotaxis response regulator CheB
MVIRKPKGLPDRDPEAKKLVSQLKAMAEVKVIRRRQQYNGKRQEKADRSTRPRVDRGPFKVVAIGASTGGPPAIRAVLEHLPSDLPVPIMIVQHISPGFVKGFVRWLNETTPVSVKLAENGEAGKPGVAYVAPDNRHLMAGSGGRIWLMDSAPVDGHRPSVTALFQSVARNYGNAAVGVLLTGMGKDGATGLKLLHSASAHTIAQDEKSSIVFGMPKEGIALGAANEVLSLEQIGKRLEELIKN